MPATPMDPSILKSTKKMLLIDPDYTAFDPDILTSANAAFGDLHDLGLGPVDGFTVMSEDEEWEDFLLDPVQLNRVKTYVFLKVKLVFDPPQTSYLLEAINSQIAQLEWRLNVSRENALPEVEVIL